MIIFAVFIIFFEGLKNLRVSAPKSSEHFRYIYIYIPGQWLSIIRGGAHFWSRMQVLTSKNEAPPSHDQNAQTLERLAVRAAPPREAARISHIHTVGSCLIFILQLFRTIQKLVCHEKHGMSPLILQHHLLEELGFWVHKH